MYTLLLIGIIVLAYLISRMFPSGGGDVFRNYDDD